MASMRTATSSSRAVASRNLPAAVRPRVHSQRVTVCHSKASDIAAAIAASALLLGQPALAADQSTTPFAQTYGDNPTKTLKGSENVYADVKKNVAPPLQKGIDEVSKLVKERTNSLSDVSEIPPNADRAASADVTVRKDLEYKNDPQTSFKNPGSLLGDMKDKLNPVNAAKRAGDNAGKAFSNVVGETSEITSSIPNSIADAKMPEGPAKYLDDIKAATKPESDRNTLEGPAPGSKSPGEERARNVMTGDFAEAPSVGNAIPNLPNFFDAGKSSIGPQNSLNEAFNKKDASKDNAALGGQSAGDQVVDKLGLEKLQQ